MFRWQIDTDLELRLLEERHADTLFALVDENREYLRRWLPWVDANTSVEDSKAFIRSLLEKFARNGGIAVGIWYGGRLVGVIGFQTLDWTNRKVEIGYWLAEAFQGRRIMTRACRAMVDYAFRELELNRVEIRCAVENRRSRAIPERLGFTQEGILRQSVWLRDEPLDMVMYAMLAREWQEGRFAERVGMG